MSVREQTESIFREVFDDPALTIREEMTADDVDGWDSLRHITLMVALEKHFGVRFATAEISKLKSQPSNVGTLLELIGAKLAG